MKLKLHVVRLYNFTHLVWTQYHKDRCLEASGNLAFTTVLSVVPVAIVMASVLSHFQHISAASLRMQNFLLEKLVPTTAESVRNNLPEITSTAEHITLVSLLFLLVTAILLLRSIDETINKIWKLHPDTNKTIRIHYYLLVIVLSPLLLGLSLSITSFLRSLPYIDTGLSMFNLEYYILGIIPVVLNAVVFTVLYKFSPRARVRLKHARTAAIVAAVMFELAKYLFSLYIVGFPNYQIIYGALSFIPIFLLWIYISWAIILFGAEICHALSLGLGKQS